MRDRSTHFGGQFEHETHFCEICAKTAERRPEGPSRFCLQGTQQVRDDPNCICNIITSDETWVYGFDPETKQQSSQWNSPDSPRPRKACQVCSNVKSILIIFFNIQGTVYKEFVPPGQIVNGNFHCEVLKRLREGIWRKRPDKWKKNNWFLHQDNAPAHTSFAVRQFLTSKNITVIPHPPYSPDLAPCRFFLFPKMKLWLKGRCFVTTEEIHAKTQEVIATLTFENFKRCMKSWETRWDRCIRAQGDYFKGDGGN